MRCDTGIFITAIRAGSAAGQDGRLAIGDRILAVSTINWYPLVIMKINLLLK